MPDALPAATFPIYPGLAQAQSYAGLYDPWFGCTPVNLLHNLPTNNY